MERKHLQTLDYARGIAIIAVLLYHTLPHAYGYDELPWDGLFKSFSAPLSFIGLLPCSFGGRAGVAMFFVVSGFCIHASFHRQGRQWGSFFIRRFFRIYPPYFAALIFSVLCLLAVLRLDFKSWFFWKDFLAHAVLVHNLSPDTLNDFNAPFWSLAVEAQLYLIYPLLLAIVGRLGWQKSLATLAALEVLIRLAQGMAETFGATESAVGRIIWLLSYSPLGFWFSWSVGAFIADAFLNNQPLPLLKSSATMWLTLAFASYFFKPTTSLPFLFFALATATIISRLLSGARPAVQVPAVLLAALQKIGLWSYSIYLLHDLFLNPLTEAFDLIFPPGSLPKLVMFAGLIFMWPVIFLFSYLWYRVFELPSIELGKRIIQKSAGKPRTAVPYLRYCAMSAALLCLAAGTLFASAQLAPPDPAENNNRAWTLATNPDPAQRNGVLAVKLAENACQQTGYTNVVMLGTLAAAYAESSRFNEAVSTAQQACLLATINGQTNLFQRNQELLLQYQNHQAYHASPQSPK